MASTMRKWFGIFVAVLFYYLIHEGSHWLVANLFGVFQSIRFLGLGIQIVIDHTHMSNWQFAVFNLAGSIATLVCGYLLVWGKESILLVRNKPFRSIAYYTTLGLLLIDPVYLSLLCGFFGGGDMNGIILLGIPELAARFLYGCIGIGNVWMILNYVYPTYQKSFSSMES